MFRKVILHACVILSVLMLAAWIDPLGDHVKKGNEHYNSEDYEAAAKEYSEADEYADGENRMKLHLNRGDAAYRQEQYNRALEHYREAAKSENRDVRKKAFLNLGNTCLKQGDREKAARWYMDALDVDPGYTAAKNNLEYLARQDDSGQQQGQKKQQDRGGQQGKQGNRQKQQQQGKQQQDAGKADKDMQGKDDRQQAMSPGQLEKLMEMMKNKPVRVPRGKGDEDGVASGKNW